MSVFELQKAQIWLNDIKHELRVYNDERAARVLRAGLHALRDRLTVDEAAHLSAQLPTMIRGLFFEGWRPQTARRRLRSRESFLSAIDRELPHLDIDASAAARAVFHVLDKHVTKGQLDNVRHSLPHQIAELWEPPIALP